MAYTIPLLDDIAATLLRDISNQLPDADVGKDSDFAIRANSIAGGKVQLTGNSGVAVKAGLQFRSKGSSLLCQSTEYATVGSDGNINVAACSLETRIMSHFEPLLVALATVFGCRRLSGSG